MRLTSFVLLLFSIGIAQVSEGYVIFTPQLGGGGGGGGRQASTNGQPGGTGIVVIRYIIS